ncbi:hypothetical protein [Nocardioides iriomotensis]|uniref:Uncharacterized protein n=1 Tax=Nocardioides iriomotensis TaxID=715784 RepID=A0A4Q5IWY9_9ACTN|nr:hypothetical protein [Nocardioides iriomotensis]RYU10602.1 hypothetical protein ETU37_15160 [Nocardioides iriomotensis]
MLADVAPLVVLTALVVAAGTADRTGRAGAVALALLSVAWLLVNGPVEGLVLLRFTPDHGLTGADLAGLAGLALAAWRWRSTGL